MAQTTKPPIFDTIDLEREIEEEFRKLTAGTRIAADAILRRFPYARLDHRRCPTMSGHRDGATEIGRLSAEAVVREYEAAAKDIEALGVELVEHVKQVRGHEPRRARW